MLGQPKWNKIKSYLWDFWDEGSTVDYLCWQITIVLTFVRFALISLEIYSVPQPTQLCPSFLISILALLLQWGCPAVGFPWPHWPSCESKGKGHRRMALLAYRSVQIGIFLPLSTILREMHFNTFLRNDKIRNGEIKRKCLGTCP